ncbi:MAG TPA: hypothetical protein VJ761_17275 [Ktedonobacteraceae bacterium]|nr:hypothetical protein [Ktedonobacteraceae bacterium]
MILESNVTITDADAQQEEFAGSLQHASFGEIEGWLATARPHLHRRE